MNELEPNGRAYIIKPASNLVGISYVLDNKEYEVIVNLEDIAYRVSKEGVSGWIEAEITVESACCEHPDGCP